MEAKISPREDASNASLAYARNRIRHKVLPELERINPRARAALARLADAAAAAADATRAAAQRALADATVAEGIALDRLADGGRDDALALFWLQATGRPLAAKHRAAIAKLAASRDGTASLDLPGGRAVREYATLRVERGTTERVQSPAETPLVEGRAVDWAGWTLTLGGPEPEGALSAPAPAAGTLSVRSRRPGDRLAGRLRIKVQDLFTDAKVPLRARAAHPLVATGPGEVWWVVGVKHAGGESSDGRRIFATPPTAQNRAILRYTGNIDGGGRLTAE
jgi:tRNA(Ile)-lysidine synthase